MVVLVLVLVWLVVILPIAVRKFSEYRLVSSVARFRHQTELLGRAHANFTSLNARLPSSEKEARVVNEAQASALRAVQTRIEARRTRRRETLLLLGSGICSTLLVGAVPSLRAFWVVAVLLAMVTGVYLALLVRCAAAEAMTAERALKIVTITTAADGIDSQQERPVAVAGVEGFVAISQTCEPQLPRLVVPGKPT